MQTAIALPAIPTGKIKSFGEFGEPYEVGHPLRQLENGDWMVAITMIKTGEQTEYRLSRMLLDPDAI